MKIPFQKSKPELQILFTVYYAICRVDIQNHWPKLVLSTHQLVIAGGPWLLVLKRLRSSSCCAGRWSSSSECSIKLLAWSMPLIALSLSLKPGGTATTDLLHFCYYCALHQFMKIYLRLQCSKLFISIFSDFFSLERKILYVFYFSF